MHKTHTHTLELQHTRTHESKSGTRLGVCALRLRVGRREEEGVLKKRCCSHCLKSTEAVGEKRQEALTP